MSDDPPGWDGLQRDDGVRVVECPVPTAEGGTAWVIERPGALPILLCPCCGKLMRSARAAKLVANKRCPRDG
jgi:hypothetical protein